IESTNGISIRNSDDGLSGEMEHCFNFVFSQHAFHHLLVLDLTAHDMNPIQHSGARQFATWNPVANESNDECAAPNQHASEPATEQPGATSHSSWPLPQNCHPARRYSQIFHGASPLLQSSSSIFHSLKVSIGCQNPVCCHTMSSPSAASRPSGSFSRTRSSRSSR